MPLGTKVGLGPGHVVLDGDPAPLRKGHRPPIFGPCLLCQTAGWIKISLIMEVGLGPGDIVLDLGPVPAPPKKKERGHSRPIFGPCLLWPNGRLSQLLLSTLERAESGDNTQVTAECPILAISSERYEPPSNT